jgi:hypothetical protein
MNTIRNCLCRCPCVIAVQNPTIQREYFDSRTESCAKACIALEAIFSLQLIARLLIDLAISTNDGLTILDAVFCVFNVKNWLPSVRESGIGITVAVIFCARLVDSELDVI